MPVKSKAILAPLLLLIYTMKTLLLATLLVSSVSFAQEEDYSKKELIQLSLERLFPDGQNKVKNADMSDIVLKWNDLFDAQNLRRDHNKDRIDWKALYPIKKNRVHEIEGKRTYYGLIPKKYRYDVIEDAKSNQLIVNVRMHFYPSKKYLKKMESTRGTEDKKYYPDLEPMMVEVKRNVKESELIWNKQAPQGVRFKFEMVENKRDAHYSIKLVTHFGALYDKFITAPAYASILSHEVGHMMGLDDEYSMITSNVLPVNSLIEYVDFKHAGRDDDYSTYKDMRCNLESIMCLKETIYPYHLDHILGRID